VTSLFTFFLGFLLVFFLPWTCDVDVFEVEGSFTTESIGFAIGVPLTLGMTGLGIFPCPCLWS